MSLLDFNVRDFFKRLGRGSTDKWTSPPSNNYFNQMFSPGQEQWETIDGNQGELFETTGALQIVILKKASMKSAGIWRHYRRDKDGKIEDLGHTDVIKLLNKPNPLQSKDEFLKQMEINRSIWGCNFMEGLKGFSSQPIPSVLYNIQPDLMTIDYTGKIYQQTKLNEIIKSFTFDKGGKGKHNYEADEILYMRLPNPNHPILPASPFTALNMEISNIRAAKGYQNVILRKKGAIGMMSGASSDGQGAIPLSTKEKERIEAQYQSDYGIGDSQMKVLITQASLTWTPMTYETSKLMLFEQISSDTKMIIDYYGLNENIFSMDQGGALSESGSKKEEAIKMVYQDTIIPESIDDAEAISRYLELPENEFLELDYSHIPALKDDEVSKSEITKRRVEAFKMLRELGIEENRALELSGLEIEE